LPHRSTRSARESSGSAAGCARRDDEEPLTRPFGPPSPRSSSSTA
jgi:hypothetical protein